MSLTRFDIRENDAGPVPRDAPAWAAGVDAGLVSKVKVRRAAQVPPFYNDLAWAPFVREDTGMIQTLVSVPAPLDAWLRSAGQSQPSPFRGAVDFIGSDPAGRKLGSGGGTVSLLHACWRQERRSVLLEDWLQGAQRLVLHAGGESRRLPAYASSGKALLPVPITNALAPARLDQVLADFQLPSYRQILREAGPHSALLVASGDVWLDLDPFALPPVRSDVAGIGMRVPPETAQHFGVYFVPKASGNHAGNGASEQPIAFFLQKPSPREIYRHATRYDFYVDTGLWLFSTAAVRFLFRRCRWQERAQRFATPGGTPDFLDLYTEVGAALGSAPALPPRLRQLGWGGLTRSVIALEQARFLHLGSNRQLLESFEQLDGSGATRTKRFSFATPEDEICRRSTLPIWVDAGHGTRWTLDGLNIASGSAGRGEIHLRQEQCLEIAPVVDDPAGRPGGSPGRPRRPRFVARPYLLDDRMRGGVGSDGTICGQDAAEWLARRGLPRSTADVFALPIYPVLAADAIDQALIDWFFSDEPSPEISTRLRGVERISAADIPNRLDFGRARANRREGHTRVLLEQFQCCRETGDLRVFDQDFHAIATHARHAAALRTWLLRHGTHLARQVARPEHQSRLLMLVAELSRGKQREEFTLQAHARLQKGVIASDPWLKSRPRLALKEDQIVWGRSPVRLDLAGGWTDTPPYCLEHGGAVLNLAVLLNRQPPIQVFVRPLRDPVLSLKSIDLGSAEVLTSFDALATFRDPRSGFSLPKAALAMAGFHPDFCAGRAAPNLRAALARFGGGLEISLLSAVPKGSGLGTSSILAATILGTLNRACTLGWDEVGLYNRVLAVEQLLTTGGGWQDQAGALFRGAKLIETAPGPSQAPTVRFLPEHLFGPAHANRTLLLYYTGITRLAKGILREIVHDMFLARFETLQTLALIRQNAHALFNAVQQNSPASVHRCIGRSWELNKRLDPGTTTPEINGILARCEPDLVAAKLLGAGGGGYMLLCAASPDAGQRIRDKLERQPPNPRARFIDFEIANSGLEVTVS